MSFSQDDESPSRSLCSEFPLAILFAVTHDLLRFGLEQGDIVLVLDYKPNSSTVPAKRGSTIIYIPKQSIKRADCDDVKRNFLKLLNKNNDSSYSHRPHRLKISPNIGSLPLHYELIGRQAIRHAESYVTVFFILVTPYPSDNNSDQRSPHPFYSTKDGSWVVAKTQRCLERLVSSLEQYVGPGGLCAWQPGSLARRPEGCSVDRWLDARAQMAADFLAEFKSPKRGFYLGSDTAAPVTPAGVTVNPLLERSRDDGVQVVSGRRREREAGGEGRKRKIRSKFTKEEHESQREEQWGSVDALLAALGPAEGGAEQHLIHGLQPLEAFLHTDKVTLALHEGRHRVGHFERGDEDLVRAVQSGDFDISPLTPLESLLRVWAVASLDKREDHLMESSWDAAAGGHWEEPETNMMAEWGTEVGVEEEYEESAEGSSDGATDEDLPGDGGSDSDSDSSRGTQHCPPDGGEIANTASRSRRFADRSARMAIMGVESSALRGRLWRGFMAAGRGTPPVETCQALNKKHLSEMQEAQHGLERFAHLGLVLLSASAPRRDRDRDRDRAARGGEDEVSVGSGSAVAPLPGELIRNSSSVSSDSGKEESYQSSVIARLNTTIRSLLVDWDSRREAGNEKTGLPEKKTAGTGGGASAVAASPHTSTLVSLLKNCRYRSSSDAPLRRYPSQLRPLSPLSSAALSTFTATRTKTRLSRRSERVMTMDRMHATERAFHSRRLTSAQMVTVLRGISGSDEAQHAALLFIVRLTDIAEVEENREFFKSLELSAEGEKRVRLVSLVLSAESRAEDHLASIHELYVKCFLVGQTAGALGKGEHVEEDGSFAPLLSLPSHGGGLSADMRGKMTALHAKLSTLRQAVSEVQGCLNSGFALHLTPLQREQDATRKAAGVLRRVVSKCEESCRLRGTLTAGRPEYLVLHRLKAAQSCSVKARAVVGEAADEATALLSAVQGILKTVEGLLATTLQSSSALLGQLRRSSLQPASGEKNSDNEGDAAAVEGAMEALLEWGGRDRDRDREQRRSGPVDMKSSMATLSGLTAACACAGWRRALEEVATENYAQFQSLIVPNSGLDSAAREAVPSHRAGSYMADTAYMCLLLSRTPFMRDVLASSSGGGNGTGKGENDESECSSMDRDSLSDKGDFSYAVYDDCEETF